MLSSSAHDQHQCDATSEPSLGEARRFQEEANALRGRCRVLDAWHSAESAWATYLQVRHVPPAELVWAGETLARLRDAVGALEEGERLHRSVLKIAKEIAHTDDGEQVLCLVLQGLAANLRRTARFSEAEECLVTATTLARQAVAGCGALNIALFRDLGELYRNLGRLTESECAYRRAMEEARDAPGTLVASICLDLATLEGRRGRYEAAQEFARRAAEIRGANDPDGGPSAASIELPTIETIGS